MFYAKDIGNPKGTREFVDAIDVFYKIAPDTASAYTACRILAAEVERLREQAQQPEPLTRPDRPGLWWVWSKAYQQWELECVGDPAIWHDGLWLPATPPPAPRSTQEP
jgi:hypothetical protein